MSESDRIYLFSRLLNLNVFLLSSGSQLCFARFKRRTHKYAINCLPSSPSLASSSICCFSASLCSFAIIKNQPSLNAMTIMHSLTVKCLVVSFFFFNRILQALQFYFFSRQRLKCFFQKLAQFIFLQTV